MSRPLRLEIAGGWYHVMNRGLRRHATFKDPEDHTLFLNTLSQACRMFGIKIGAYCLMPNHYHLLVNTPNANLSRFMRHVNGVYTQRFNRKNGKDGPLFRGRYRALIIDADAYLLQVVRYIHMNPVKARLCLKPESYRWCSHKGYIKPKTAPDWLCNREVLTWFSAKPGKALEQYKGFMKEPQDPRLEEFYKRKKIGWLLGDEGFMEKMKQRVADIEAGTEEIPQGRKAQGEIGIKTVIRVVRREFKVPLSALMESKRGELNMARNMALYLSWELTGLTQREIAETFGARSYRTVASHHFRIKNEMNKDKKLKRLADKLRKKCSQIKT
ncbi:MAG: transposase [Candidatus Nitronauta litoralis]|uniref:Transposase n=1 Tax=Candidatus Nitronauta litoralis TaxID=2705533 RepID=A0A7T0BXL2_9BACT|nr:MAG: transposase [Candidatus Nitronauta litoralis]